MGFWKGSSKTSEREKIGESLFLGFCINEGMFKGFHLCKFRDEAGLTSWAKMYKLDSGYPLDFSHFSKGWNRVLNSDD